MLRNRRIASKLILLILASITLIFALTFGYNYFLTRRIIVSNIDQSARNLSLATVNRIDKVLGVAEKVPKNLAVFLEISPDCTCTQMVKLLRSIVENNPEIYGATIAFEPYEYDKDTLIYALSVYRFLDMIDSKFIRYEYFYRDWYQIPKELNHPVWSEPYYSEAAGDIIMSTFSVPFYKNDQGVRKFMGIATADVSLTFLQKIVSSIKIEQTGFGFLLSKNGTIVTHPDERLIMNDSIFSVAESLGDARMRELGRSMIRGESGFVPVENLFIEKCWISYAPLPSNGWSLGVLFPQDELMDDIYRLNRTVLFISLAGFLFILVVIVLIARSITRPLRILSKATEHIATGNLDIEIPPIKSRDEVGKLADSLDYMKKSLKQYIKELTETTAAKERMESDLKIAHDIQMGILPKSFPPFPDRHEIEIYATIEPAKEVGGDLYDFFFVDDDHLCFTVGDVSDKGVPASLFMAITRTLVKTKASQGLTPGIVLSRVNQDLSIDNPSLMFVTLFLGFLNIRTGAVEYVNGGHNPPYLMHENGEIARLEMTNGIALGVVEDVSYQSKKIFLKKGESLFLYTDGVTEAMNEENVLFSEKRLERHLSVLRDEPVKDVVEGINKEVKVFSQGVPQTDDITIMIIRYHGTKP
ncbi:MAG: SpoIIE family protein phosphatase [Deltaproteobacteria bacterium]|nr:SpoIIE family protein phosphatase [Deltaproteobacteria bacterium]